MKKMLTYSDFDREFWNRELEDFVPQKLYDMHTHLWTEKGQEHLPPGATGLRTPISFVDLCDWSEQLYPGRECHFLVLGTPVIGMDAAKHNKWLAGELANDEHSIGGMLVTPTTTQEELADGFEKDKFAAVKPYRLFAADPKSARITDFLSEPQLEVINAHRKAITLHLSMPTGADAPENIEDLQYLTKKYPDIKWILAHCARAFNAIFLEKSIHILKHIPNIYYDTSAVNDLYSHYLLLKHENHERIMFGSDNVAASCARGKYFSYAGAWQFSPGWEQLPHCDARATLVIYEQLLQQKRAADILELSKDTVNKIFWQNARSLIKEIKRSK